MKPIHIKYFTFVIISFISQYCLGQCTNSTKDKIADLSSISSQIIIEGAVNNNLATNNKVCQVKIKFRHTTIGDLEMFLISPGGQRIQLIGEAGLVTQPTDLSTWDVTFVQCTANPLPDNEVPKVWDNARFGVGRNYMGSYYPNDGCLEDINQGQVNGTWTLRITDVSTFDEGEIESFSIVFCNEQGITCAPCNPPIYNQTKPNILGCKGENLNQTEFNTTVISGVEDLAKYTKDYIIFKGNQYVGLYSDRINTLDTGKYQFCVTAYNRLDKPRFAIPGVTNINVLKDKLTENGVCATVGNCTNVDIRPVTDTFTRNVTLCLRDSIVAYGTTIKTQGTFFLLSKAGKCDSVFKYVVDLIDIKPTFTLSNPEITCTIKDLLIDVKYAEPKQGAYRWWTSTGNILFRTDERFITVNKEGKYYVEITVGQCTWLDSIAVTESQDIPKIGFVGGSELNCFNPQLAINATSTKPIMTISWQVEPANLPFTSTGPNITITSPGTYYATVIDNNGCQKIDSIKITSDFTLPVLNLDYNNITCNNPVAIVNLKDSTNLRSVNWLAPQIIFKNAIAQIINQSGIYNLEINGYNGCRDTIDVAITGNNMPLSPILLGDSVLTCANPSLTLSVVNPPASVVYTWDLPGNGTATTSSLVVNNPGIYSLSIVDTGGCVGKISQLIKLDTLRPFISVQNQIISCNNDSLIVRPDSIRQNFKYQWSGRDIVAKDTFAIVNKAGVYSVTVSDVNGCTNSTNFSIVNSMDHPMVTFAFDSITCTKSSALIFPIGSITGLSFYWKSGPFVGDSTDFSVGVDRAGDVVLEIKDPVGCKNEYLFQIMDLRSAPVFTKKAEVLSCSKDTVVINYTSSLPMKSIFWNGPGGFQSSILTPSVFQAGWYFVSLEDSLGCTFQDSILIEKKIETPQLSFPSVPNINCNPLGINTGFNSIDSLKSISWLQSGNVISTSRNAIIRSPGKVDITIINQFNCRLDTTIIFPADTIKPKGTILSNDHFINCLKKSANLEISVSEGLGFSQWKGPRLINPLLGKVTVDSAGLYTFVMRDTSLCTDSVMIEVKDLSQFPAITARSNPITCDNGGQLIITSDIKLDKVEWSRPTTRLNDSTYLVNNIDGIYRYTGTTAGNCERSGQVEVTVDMALPDVVIINDTITCDQSRANIGVMLSKEYRSIRWEGVSDTTLSIEVNTIGKYRVEVTNKNGCVKTDSITVISDLAKPIIDVLPDTLTCKKGKLDLIVLTSTLLKSADWIRSNGSSAKGQIIKIEEPGLYTVLATGMNGCISADSVTISQDIEKPLISIKDTFFISCDFKPIDVTLDSNQLDNVVLWSGVDKAFISRKSIAEVNQLVFLYVYVTSTNGCQSLDSTRIVLDTILPKYALVNDTIKCNPDFAKISTTNFSEIKNYEWLDNRNNIVSTDSILLTKNQGEYKVIVKGPNACPDTTNFMVIKDTLGPNISIAQRDSFICENKEITLFGSINHSRPYTFMWSTLDGNITSANNVNIKINKSGTYKFTAKDNYSNCQADTSIMLTYKPNSLLSFSADATDLNCNNKKDGAITITNVGNNIGTVVTQINSKAFTNKFIYNNLSEGSYKVAIKDSLGCIAEKSIMILDGESATLQLNPTDTLIDLGDSVVMTYNLLPSNGIRNAYWIIAGDTVCRNCTNYISKLNESSELKLLIVDQFGCVYEDVAKIEVNTNPFIIIPNAIRIGSLANGKYSIPEYSSIDKIVDLSIYDVWGNRVYHLANISPHREVGWDGFYNGAAVNPGVFVVHIQIILKDGRIKNLYRDLTVVR